LEKKDRSKAVAVIRIILLALLGLILVLVLEFGKHTIWGWALCAAVFAGYVVMRCTVLRSRKGLWRFGSVVPFLILLGAVLFLSQPPYRFQRGSQQSGNPERIYDGEPGIHPCRQRQ